MVVPEPMIYYATLRWGAVGSAGVWIVLNCGYLLISAPVMFRRLLPAEKWRWYVSDVANIVLVVLIVTGIARAIVVNILGDAVRILILVATVGLASVAPFVHAKELLKMMPIYSTK